MFDGKRKPRIIELFLVKETRQIGKLKSRKRIRTREKRNLMSLI